MTTQKESQLLCVTLPFLFSPLFLKSRLVLLPLKMLTKQ